MRVRITLTLLLVAITHAGFARAVRAGGPSDEDVANSALDVISTKYPTPHDNYVVVICSAAQAKKLAADTAVGAFVRYMHVVKSTTAVIVAPDGFSNDAKYVVYFDGSTPLGFGAFDPSAARPSDADVDKAFTRVNGPVEKKKRQPLYKPAFVPVDDGELKALRIVGWQ